MMNTQNYNVQNELIRYLAGDITLDQFREEFDRKTWELAETDSQYAIASAAELLLAEFSSGDRSERELKQALLALVKTVQLEVCFSTCSATQGVEQSVRFGSAVPTHQYERLGKEYAEAS